ncbi:MAG: alpha/beta fold hydrolase [Acidobacteriota bacterium]
MRVFLLHGMGRTPASMGLMALRLRLDGHRPNLFGYFVVREELDAIAERFRERVERVVAEDRAQGDAEGYCVVGHSLGCVITRMASPHLPQGFRRFVMLTPPNRPPAIARALADNKVFQALSRDAGRQLVDDGFFDTLPRPDVPTLVIAGSAGPRHPLHPAGSSDNDGILGVDEMRLDGAPLLQVPALHTFVMNRGDVYDAVLSFFETGRVPAEAA